MIKDSLQQLDLDYYRTLLLHVARAELERLRQEQLAGRGFERWSEFAFGESSTAAAGDSAEAAHADVRIGDAAMVRG